MRTSSLFRGSLRMPSRSQIPEHSIATGRISSFLSYPCGRLRLPRAAGSKKEKRYPDQGRSHGKAQAGKRIRRIYNKGYSRADTDTRVVPFYLLDPAVSR